MVVRAIEDNLRALLRDLVCGHLGPDLVGIAEGLLSARPPLDAAKDAPAPEPPPEADFVVHRTRPERLFEPTEELTIEETVIEEPDAAEPDTAEPDTEETVAVGGVREVEPEGEAQDWLLDDDAADYSGAV